MTLSDSETVQISYQLKAETIKLEYYVTEHISISILSYIQHMVNKYSAL